MGDQDGLVVDFHIANNDGASSSIFEFGKELGFHKLSMSRSEKLVMNRLDSIFSQSDLEPFAHWVLDVQGAEILVLKGSGLLLNQCKSLYIEVSTREVYKDGASWEELSQFLRSRGLIPLWNPRTKSHENLIFIRY